MGTNVVVAVARRVVSAVVHRNMPIVLACLGCSCMHVDWEKGFLMRVSNVSSVPVRDVRVTLESLTMDRPTLDHGAVWSIGVAPEVELVSSSGFDVTLSFKDQTGNERTSHHYFACKTVATVPEDLVATISADFSVRWDEDSP